MTLALQIILAGIIAGALLGMPIGPNGVLCLYRSVRYGWSAGVATALGCVLSVTAHSMLSMLFMNKLMRSIEQTIQLNVVYVFSGIVMIIIGVIFLFVARLKKEDINKDVVSRYFLTNFFSAMLVSFVNPKNIIGFSTLVLSLSWLTVVGEASLMNSFLFGFGCFLSVASLFSILIYLAVSTAGKSLQKNLPILKYSVSTMFLVFGSIRILSVIY